MRIATRRAPRRSGQHMCQGTTLVGGPAGRFIGSSNAKHFAAGDVWGPWHDDASAHSSSAHGVKPPSKKYRYHSKRRSNTLFLIEVYRSAAGLLPFDTFVLLVLSRIYFINKSVHHTYRRTFLSRTHNELKDHPRQHQAIHLLASSVSPAFIRRGYKQQLR